MTKYAEIPVSYFEITNKLYNLGKTNSKDLPKSLQEMKLSNEQIINLFNVAGFGVGIGEQRPTAVGGFNYGTFHIKNNKDK